MKVRIRTLWWITVIMILLGAGGCGMERSSGSGEIALWGLVEQTTAGTNAVTGRVGYRLGWIEPFLGSTWRPGYDAGGGVQPPQVISLGVLVYAPDLLDPNAPVPWLPDLLLRLLPQRMVARPYIGSQGSYNLIDSDAGFYGGILGLEAKLDPDARMALIVEGIYNNYFDDLGAVPELWRVNIGFRVGF
jgi:hypothetical protein